MPTAPDDLPRSPSGRVPQWVIDEANGRATRPTAWRPPTQPLVPLTPTRRRTRWPGLVVVTAVIGLGAWWLTSGTTFDDVATALTDGPAAPVPPPSAEVVALADEAHLSPAGRDVLFAARPALLDARSFAGQCEVGGAAPARSDGAVGCYRPDGTIAVLAPTDPRLRGFVVETVAHETLHAAWDTLTPAEHAELAPVLEAQLTLVATDDPLREQLAGSVGAQPGSRPTELFAYIGTQVWRDGGLDARLETVYERFVRDRAALVGVHTAFEDQLRAIAAGIDAGDAAARAVEARNAQTRAQYDADAAAVERWRQEYHAQVAALAAMPASQRSRLRLSWTWWDGTELPMAPAEHTLAAAADLLARDDRELPARLEQIGAAEALAAAERSRLDALVADYNGLRAQMHPGGTT